jgi:hypothetical protein
MTDTRQDEDVMQGKHMWYFYKNISTFELARQHFARFLSSRCVMWLSAACLSLWAMCGWGIAEGADAHKIPFVVATQTRSASYLMTELLNCREAGVYCGGELLNPLLNKDDKGSKLVTFEDQVKRMKDYYQSSEMRAVGFKLLYNPIKSPTNRYFIDLVQEFPEMRIVFLVRDPFDSTISDYEARVLRKWSVLNPNSSSPFQPETDLTVNLTTSAVDKYLSSTVSILPELFMRLFFRRCIDYRRLISSSDYFERNRLDISILVHTEDLMNVTLRYRIMERIYKHLLNLSHGDPLLQELMDKMKEAIFAPKNERGRSALPLHRRIARWALTSKNVLSYLLQVKKPGTDEVKLFCRDLLIKRMKEEVNRTLDIVRSDEMEKLPEKKRFFLVLSILTIIEFLFHFFYLNFSKIPNYFLIFQYVKRKGGSQFQRQEETTTRNGSSRWISVPLKLP